MDEDAFRDLVRIYLLPLFSGAELEEQTAPSNAQQATAAFRDPCAILVKPAQDSEYRLVVRRSQPFENRELQVVRTFVEILQPMLSSVGSPIFTDLLASFTRRVVARCVNSELETLLLLILDQCNLWGNRLYEGRRISASIGIDPTQQGTGGLMSRVWRFDFSAVISNGIDTLVVCDEEGSVVSHDALNDDVQPSYAPHRFRLLTSWANESRIAIAPTTAGEILVFQNRQVAFARRGGIWHFFTHEHILTQMHAPQAISIRRAIYESCLDASFAKTGACVSVVTSGNRSRVSSFVDIDDIRVTAQ